MKNVYLLGFTVPEVDKILSYYAKKSYEKYCQEYISIRNVILKSYKFDDAADDESNLVNDYAMKKLRRDFEQGWQGIEYKLNTVGSSRGDYPFITMTIGLATDVFGKMAAITLLDVHSKGQGKNGFKRPVLFPKIVFLYDKDLHGDGSPQYPNADVFNAGIDCSSKTMYPDWLSLTGEGYVPSMYKKYKKVVSPMGCVDGSSRVTYRYYGIEFCLESFESMWDYLSGFFEVKPQIEGEPHLYMDLQGVEIYDTLKGFVKCNKIIRNVSDEWLYLTLKTKRGTERYLMCTPDHPLATRSGETKRADSLNNTDQILVDTSEYANVKEVIKLNSKQAFSYDVSTESEHFEVNGIYSHNCRAFLSPWYERGGMNPADENDSPVFEGRFNMGVISLNLPMILAKSRQESKDFYEVLDYYLEMIRNHHKRTIDYIGELRASVNPVMFCEGGALGGYLKPNEKIKSILAPMTISYGITALNELQRLYNGKSIREDGMFALEVMQHIQSYIDRIKKEDNILYAIYGTPAESLCFAGDTEVQTYEGNKKIKDITTNDLVYSFNVENHKVELKKVLCARKTIENASLVEILFDNGQKIRCTPNHKFAVRRSNQNIVTGVFQGAEKIEWVEAANLTTGDRIKSNYITLNSLGRPQCSIYHNGRHQLIQDINSEYSLGEKPDGYVVHHKNKNKEDNSFENLQYVSDSEHRALHIKDNLKIYEYTSESQSGKNNSFYGRKHTNETKLKNRLAHIGKSIEVFSNTMEHIGSFQCANDAEKAGFTRHLVKLACEGKKGHLYKNLYWYYTNDQIPSAELNHKVVSVSYLSNREDVYDIEVEDNHNFFVGGDQGILVHNCGLQVEQFRKIYGIIENVSDREYVSNSFHCHVSEDMTPIEKQDKEERFWNYFNGGKIQYVRYTLGYNKEAIKTLVLRAMKKGFYEGVNLALCYCEDCGYQQIEMDVCPMCGSSMITKIDRMNGYLGFTRVHGETRYNEAKNAEIADRISM